MKKTTVKFIIVVGILLAAYGLFALFHARSLENLVYAESLDKTAVEVDGTVLTLRDIAFYVGYEEMTVEEQAETYSSEDTNAYWNLHIDGQFVRVAAKKAAMDMAVHDQIFYEEAIKMNLELTPEEEESYESSASDFISDLTEERRECLGVTEEELRNSIYKIALAQKYQNVLSDESGRDYAVYDIAGTAYKEIKAEHKIKINEAVWKRIDFGNVTLTHSQVTYGKKMEEEQ